MHYKAHGPLFIGEQTICCTPYSDILEQSVFLQQLEDNDSVTF
jgi:hypothetical protein